jgi:hypothetical protein
MATEEPSAFTDTTVQQADEQGEPSAVASAATDGDRTLAHHSTSPPLLYDAVMVSILLCTEDSLLAVWVSNRLSST